MTPGNLPTRHYGFFILAMLIMVGLVGYLGFRAIEHEALLKRYQSEELAQERIGQAQGVVVQLLENRASRLQSAATHMQLDDAWLKALIDSDADIDGIFIIDRHGLLYPAVSYPSGTGTLNAQEQRLVDDLAPVLRDPYLLMSHNIVNEASQPRSGWYFSNTADLPLLVYWIRKDEHLVIGFRLSYVMLLSDVVNRADLAYAEGSVHIMENDRLIYASATDLSPDDLVVMASQRMAYPLTNWQVVYYGQAADTLAVYLWGSVLVVLLLAVIALVVYGIYREYTRSAREAMQQINFVSQVSHELKTPLTNITLYAELLKEELEGYDDETKEHAGIIIDESQRLSRLIQNILTFTRTPQVVLKPVPVNELVEQIAQMFMPSFAAKGLELRVDVGADVCVHTDEDRVSQIICNFLSNAEKYAASGKRVDLSVQVHGKHVDIRVRDYGSGIPVKDHKLIFKPFYRIHSSITEGVSGTGIGLTIAAQLAYSLGAEIKVENSNPGTCFTFRLQRGGQAQQGQDVQDMQANN